MQLREIPALDDFGKRAFRNPERVQRADEAHDVHLPLGEILEHREALGETWRSWIPLVYCGLTLLGMTIFL